MTELQPGYAGVLINVKDVYDLALGASTKLDVLLTQHGALTATLQDHIQHSTAVHTDLEQRMRAVERGRWPLPAAATLIALASVAVALVSLLTR